MTPEDARWMADQTRALFPGIDRFWTPERLSVLVEVFANFKGDREQAVAVVREHCASEGATVPNIGKVRAMLRACEPNPVTVATQQALAEYDRPGDPPITSWLREVANRPDDDPKKAKWLKRAKSCEHSRRLMERALQ
jgi:hypothetical protein